MKVAALQTRPVFGDVEANVARALALSSKVDAALYVFPELTTSGYAFASRLEARALAEIPGGREAYAPGLHALGKWARSRRAWVIAGFPEKSQARVYNSAALIAPDGRVRDVYRKLHLFDDEKLWFAPGDRAPRVSRVGSARVGMLVCFDWRFPEIWRVLALAGADLIAHPSNLVVPRAAQMATPVRAMENRVYVVTANRVGADVRPDRRIAFTGRSQVVSPDGIVLARAGSSSEKAIVADVDLKQARNKKFGKTRNEIFKDRRPEFYGRVSEKKR